jgi:dipeptidyl aminopeptidase/acylaminoacyl peptidase
MAASSPTTSSPATLGSRRRPAGRPPRTSSPVTALTWYIREYEAELGPPWRNADAWLRLSYPFLHADRITTPTLFLCGERDFNVPLLNSEQMYQALRSLGVDTELVIYPGQSHGLSKPSYQRDRMERYIAWYGKYLKK